MAKKVSQQTIADSLGISQAIVSGVLNDKPVRASEAVRNKIFEKAKELNYRKPRSSKKSPDLIGLIIHDEQWENLLQVSRGMRRYLEGTNTLIIHHEWLTDELPPDLLDNVKGCISVSAELAKNPGALTAIRSRLPLVMILVHDLENRFDAVLQDSAFAYRQALTELRDLGHRRFGYFGIRDMHLQQSNRVASFLAAVLELDCPQPEHDWLYLPYREEATETDTRQRIRHYLDKLTQAPAMPTAIFFEHDGYASLFRDVAAEYDLKVPDDISIIGHTDRDPEPGLATITVPYEDMGFMAVKVLLDRIENPDHPVMEYRLADKWLPGASIAKAQQ